VEWLAGNRVAIGSLGDASWTNTVATDTESVRSIIGALSAHFELVILDLPPVSRSIASPAFAGVVDGVLLVVEAERTRAHAVRSTYGTLNIHGGNVLGVVLNKRRSHTRHLLRRGRAD
jgi:Mrp family chromosome partitioning ATPase